MSANVVPEDPVVTELCERIEEANAYVLRRASQHAHEIADTELDEPDSLCADEITARSTRDGSTVLVETPSLAAADRIGRRVKLHGGHFAFMRAYVEGLDVRAMWSRYLGIHGAITDIRSVRRGLRALRSDLAAAARRSARPYMERLIREIDVDIRALPDIKPYRLPSLEEFAVDQGLDGEREVDQLRAYHEAFGKPTQQVAGRLRQLKHQLAALRCLEALAAEKPAPDDAVGAWLREEFAAPLEAVGVVTLRQLVLRINGMGRGWSTGLRGIGAGKAARIVAWLREPDHDIGLPISDHATMARRQVPEAMLQKIVAAATDVVPIEKFIVPESLDGRSGLFRGPRPCMLTADTDFDAMLAYIRSKPGATRSRASPGAQASPSQSDTNETAHPLAWLRLLSKTQADYLAEIYRFMLWSILERQKATSSINMEDAAAYRDFLVRPEPAERWCSGARGREKYGPAWRPFVGPLSSAAANKALTILRGWYNFLHRSGYQTANPFVGIKAAEATTEVIKVERGFTQHEWAYIDDQLGGLAATSANVRLRFGVRCMYATGMRRAEAVSATIGHLRWVSYSPTADDPGLIEGWELSIVGKGNKRRVVPVPDSVIDDLKDYLVMRGLPQALGDPAYRQAFLLGKAVDVAAQAPWAPAARGAIDPMAGIGAQTWYDQLKAFFRRCAAQLEGADPQAASQFERASAHWLRHTKISHSLAAGTSQQVERELAGHHSLETTSQYTHTSAKQRMRASADFFHAHIVGRRAPFAESL